MTKESKKPTDASDVLTHPPEKAHNKGLSNTAAESDQLVKSRAIRQRLAEKNKNFSMVDQTRSPGNKFQLLDLHKKDKDNSKSIGDKKTTSSTVDPESNQTHLTKAADQKSEAPTNQTAPIAMDQNPAAPSEKSQGTDKVKISEQSPAETARFLLRKMISTGQQNFSMRDVASGSGQKFELIDPKQANTKPVTAEVAIQTPPAEQPQQAAPVSVKQEVLPLEDMLNTAAHTPEEVHKLIEMLMSASPLNAHVQETPAAAVPPGDNTSSPAAAVPGDNNRSPIAVAPEAPPAVRPEVAFAVPPTTDAPQPEAPTKAEKPLLSQQAADQKAAELDQDLKGGLLSGANMTAIKNMRDDLSAAQFRQVIESYEQKHGEGTFTKALDKLSPYDKATVNELLGRKDGEVNYGGNVDKYIAQAETDPAKAAQNLRTMYESMTKSQIEKFEKDFSAEHGGKSPMEMINGSKISQGDKTALAILEKGNDHITLDDKKVLAEIAIGRQDGQNLHMLQEVFTGMSKEDREQIIKDPKFQEQMAEAREHYAKSVDEYGKWGSRCFDPDSAETKDILEKGGLRIQTVANADSGILFGYLSDQKNVGLMVKNATPEDKQQFAEGRELHAHLKEHPAETLNKEQQEALKLYEGTMKALERFGGNKAKEWESKLCGEKPQSTEKTDNLANAMKPEEQGDMGGSGFTSETYNTNKFVSSLSQMTPEEANKYKTDEAYRKQVDSFVNKHLSVNEQDYAKEILAKIAETGKPVEMTPALQLSFDMAQKTSGSEAVEHIKKACEDPEMRERLAHPKTDEDKRLQDFVKAQLKGEYDHCEIGKVKFNNAEKAFDSLTKDGKIPAQVELEAHHPMNKNMYNEIARLPAAERANIEPLLSADQRAIVEHAAKNGGQMSPADQLRAFELDNKFCPAEQIIKMVGGLSAVQKTQMINEGQETYKKDIVADLRDKIGSENLDKLNDALKQDKNIGQAARDVNEKQVNLLVAGDQNAVEGQMQANTNKALGDYNELITKLSNEKQPLSAEEKKEVIEQLKKVQESLEAAKTANTQTKEASKELAEAAATVAMTVAMMVGTGGTGLAARIALQAAQAIITGLAKGGADALVKGNMDDFIKQSLMGVVEAGLGGKLFDAALKPVLDNPTVKKCITDLVERTCVLKKDVTEDAGDIVKILKELKEAKLAGKDVDVKDITKKLQEAITSVLKDNGKDILTSKGKEQLQDILDDLINDDKGKFDPLAYAEKISALYASGSAIDVLGARTGMAKLTGLCKKLEKLGSLVAKQGRQKCQEYIADLGVDYAAADNE